MDGHNTPKPARESLVLLCDIERYSVHKPEEQRALISGLWEFAQGDTWLPVWVSTLGPRKTSMWGTGDGFYLVGWEIDSKAIDDCYSFTRRLINEMRSRFNAELRVAMHHGLSDWVFPHDRNRFEVFGTALNDAQRILGFADSGQVVFSEAMVQRWKELGGDLPDSLYPSETVPPYQVYVKHGVPGYVRFDSDVSSKAFRRISRASDLLVAAMDDFILYLSELLEKYAVDSSSRFPRVSIFTPGKFVAGRPTRLNSTRFRRRPGRVTDLPGRTWYGIGDTGSGASGIGIAFDKKVPDVLALKADSRVDLNDYVAEVALQWNLPVEVVQRWNPKPRTLFAIPLGLTVDDPDPAACVCIDCHACLYSLKDRELDTLKNQIHVEAVKRLSHLFNLL